MTLQKIRTELSKQGFIDYKFLAKKSHFALYPELLTDLLKKAEDSFDQILQVKNGNISFNTVVETYLNHDHVLSTLYTFLESLNSTNTSPSTRKIIETFEPKMVDYANKTTLNKNYYKLLEKVSRQNLTADQARSVSLLLKGMKMSGVFLAEDTRKMVERINKDLSELSQKFENNTIDSRKEFYFECNDKSIVKEMPESDVQAAMVEAEQRKSKSKYVFTLSPPSLQAILKYCSDRSVRELFYKKAFTVACEGKFDNRPLILKILKLRQKKAELLGCKNYAEYILQARMAESTKQIETLLYKIYKKAKSKATQEIQQLAKFSGLKKVEEWDITYYSEKFKQQKFKLEAKKMQEFFPRDQVIKGLFSIFSNLFDIQFKPLKQESYYPDVQVFEIWKEQQLLAYYLADFSARPSKKGGAWCNHLRSGYVSSDGEYHVPIVINVMNFPSSNGAEPPLLSHRDVETLFHEFGHALHVMFSSKTYANLSGFQTEWDFVEFPSQLLENWCWEMDALKIFAKHYQTKKDIPEAMVEKLRATKTFMSGYRTLRQLEFAFLDLTLHTQEIPDSLSLLDSMCGKIVRTYGAVEKFKEYSMYTSFDHIFAGGYAAGYYSYMWAEILESDVFLMWEKTGVLDKEMALNYLKKILMPGAKKAGRELFKDFMGRDPDVDAFIKKHELAEDK